MALFDSVRGLSFALRGLWWRRSLSAAVLVVSALVVGIAAAGPTYDRAAKESVLQDTLRSAPSIDSGLEVVGSASPDGLLQPVQKALEAAHLDPYGAPIESQEYAYDGRLGCTRPTPLAVSGCNVCVSGYLVARSNAVGLLRLTAGKLPHAAGQVVASDAFLTANGVRVGDALSLDPAGGADGSAVPRVTVVGSYTTDERAPGWFSRPYWPDLAYPGLAACDPGGGNGADPLQDALLTVPGTLDPLVTTGVVDLPIATQKVRVAQAARLTLVAQDVRQAAGESANGGDQGYLQVETALPFLLAQAAADEHSLGTPILLIVLQLVLLCGLVLLSAVRSSAEARGPEVALAALRRFPRRDVVLFGLAEPLILMPLSIPLGLLLGWLATLALASGQLLPGTPVVLPVDAVLAAVVAVAVAAVATAGIGLRIVRRPPAEQWRRATQRTSGRPWWIDAVVVAAAVAGIVVLVVTGGLSTGVQHQGSDASPYALLAPALLALAVAMVGSRLLPLACRALYGRTRRGTVGAFLAVRQVARRPTTLSATVLLTVALALATFAVSAATVAGRNRHAVAGTQVGAPTVLTVHVPAGRDLGNLVDAADPSGRQAMAALDLVDRSGSHRELVGVQPARLAAVAYWRPDFAHGLSPAAVAARLVVPGLHSVTLTGDRVLFTATTTALRGASDIRPTVTLAAPQGQVTVAGPVLPPDGATAVTMALPDCSRGCRLVSIGVRRDALGTTNLAGTLTVGPLRVGAGPSVTTVTDAYAGGAAGWRAASASAGTAAVTDVPDGLAFAFDLPWYDTPSFAPRSLPAAVPVAVGEPADFTPPTTLLGFDHQPLAVRTVVDAAALPRVGSTGELVDRELAIRAANVTFAATDEVWLAAGASPDVLARLQAAGVTVTGRSTITGVQEALGRQGPPLALALFRVGAVVAAVLALLGTALGLALAGRRRAFELSALFVLGLPRRALWRSVAAEQGTLLGYGALLGVAVGLVGARVALPSVPEFVTPPTAPTLHYAPPYLLVVGIAVGLAALVVAGAVGGAAVLVRAVRADRLREYVP